MVSAPYQVEVRRVAGLSQPLIEDGAALTVHQPVFRAVEDKHRGHDRVLIDVALH